MTRLLIVAPNPELRRSLRFALEAEGYDVTAVNDIAAAGGMAPDFACTILDHHGGGLDAAQDRAFVRRFAPVVLLANLATHPLASASYRTLTKPSLGSVLSEAVRDAIASVPTK